MSNERGTRRRALRSQHALKAACIGAAVAMAAPAAAFKIDTGSPDLEVTLDTAVRYNAAVRTGERDLRLVNSPAVDEGNWLFGKNDTALSRFDIYSELDLSYKRNMGLRLSATGWYDNNFPDRSRSDPRFATVPNYARNEFTGYIDRYYKGPSAEFMDAFAWTNLDFGGTSLNLKAGRFAWLPGEFLFGNGGSVSYSMAPNDGRKSDLSPGASAKETALPIGQVGAIWQLNNAFSLMGQYTGEFRSSRISEGGTFWQVNDTALEGPQFISNPAVPRAPSFKGDKGDIALGLKWSPEKLEGDAFGLWLRRFDDKNPSWLSQIGVNANGSRIGRAVHAKDIELIGLTYNTLLAGWGTGIELNYRRKMPLNVRSGFAFGTFPGLVRDPGMEGPRGNTVHFLMSAVSTINKNALFDSGSIALQFDAMHLDKITSGASLYNGRGGNPACTDNLVLRGCSTRNAASIALSFTPTWQQVFPSVDISAPLFVTYGLTGNAAAVNAGVTPKGSWLVRPGIRVEYLAGKYKHQFDLSYTARGGKTGNIATGPGAAPFFASGLANFRDRNYLSFTYQTAF